MRNIVTTRYRPLYYFLMYISFTLILAVAGPVEYRDFDAVPVLLYMSAFMALFAFGYFLGASGTHDPYLHVLGGYKLKKILTILKLCIAVAFIYKLFEFAALLADGGNVSLQGAGRAYAATYEGYERGTGEKSMSFILSIFLGLPLYVSMILGIYYFERLNYRYKAMLIMIFALFLMVNTFGQGKQKYLGDMGIIVFTIMSLKITVMANYRVKRRIKFLMLGILSVGFLLLLEMWTLRYAAMGVNLLNINEVAHPLISFKTKSPIFSILPESIMFPLSILSTYLSQGYYGLSITLNMDFVWTYLIGGSYTTMALANQVFGAPLLLVDTYPYRAGIEFGWGMEKWHSVFPWLASDMTFFGVLIFFSAFAYVYSTVWIEAYKFSNPISIVLLCVLTIGLIYVPANNQLFHNPSSFFTVFTLILVWILKRKKYNFSRI